MILVNFAERDGVGLSLINCRAVHGCTWRPAMLLIGGDKTGDGRWYETNVPLADRLYDEHLEQLRKEGLIDG